MARTQENRQAKLITPLGDDVLLLYRMVASEAVSDLYEYDLIALSEDENIELNDLIGQHAYVELELPHDETRYFSGHVTRFSFVGFQGRLAKYRLRLSPWLWFLTLNMDNRIFQGDSALDIIKEVCKGHGFTDLDDKTTGNYRDRNFCVQYHETDYAFLSRIMEEEGISFYFVHEKDKHTMVLADGISSHEPFGDYDKVPWFAPDEHEHRERDHLTDWQMSREVKTGKHTMRDYNFETPKANLEVQAQITRPIEHAEFERYEYPGEYRNVDEGEAYDRCRIEEDQASFEILRGSGNARGLIPGFLFELEQFPRDDQNREYLILSVNHEVTLDNYDSAQAQSDQRGDYACSLTAMPSSEVFRPKRTTAKPIVHGPQTAIVVGEKDEEIWTNKYGEVKVKFHWDRAGGRDQNSSCWVRVSQSLAGKQWGAQFLPRMGHEVIVEFLEGDPDRPIITGSVYNADNMPPFDLPENKTQSGWKTRSSKDGTAQNFNEIRFEDKKGEEKVYLHAEKDMGIVVENDQYNHVGVNRSKQVGGNEDTTVFGYKDVVVGDAKPKEFKVDVDLSFLPDVLKEIFDGKASKPSDGDYRLTISNDYTLDIRGDWDAEVQGDTKLDIKGSWDVDIKGDTTIDTPGRISITAANDIHILDGTTVDVTSGTLKLNNSWWDSKSGTSTSLTGQSLSVTGNSTSATGASESATGGSVSVTALSMSGTHTSMSVTGLSMSETGLNVGHTVMKLDHTSFEIKKVGGMKLESTPMSLSKSGLKMIS